MVIRAVLSLTNDAIVSENTLHLIAIKRDTYYVLLKKSQYLAQGLVKKNCKEVKTFGEIHVL